MPSKSRSVVLHVIHLPIVLLLIGLLVLGGIKLGSLSKSVNSNADESSILGDDNDDEDDDNDSSGSGSGDDEDDDDEDNSGSSSGDEDDKDEDEDEDRSGSNSGSSNDDGEDDLEDLDIEDDEDEQKFKTVSFDEFGNKVVREYENEDGRVRIRYKVYNPEGNKLFDYRLRTEDGKELELRIKEGETELTRVKFDQDNQELLVRIGSLLEEETEDSKLRIRAEGDAFTLTRSGIEALANFPMIVDPETGEISVVTPVGEILLGAMPDSIVEKAKTENDIDEVEDVSLEAGETLLGDPQLKYILTATKAQSILGLFNLQIPTVLEYDAQTGGFIGSEPGSFFARILELFNL